MAASVEIEATGIISDEGAAYPSLVRLENGDILASYTVGGGPLATGGTGLARSRDEGRTWRREPLIFAATEAPPSTNSLRLSLTPDGTLLAYGFRKFVEEGDQRFGRQTRRDVVYKESPDGGLSWGPLRRIPTREGCSWEVSNPILALDARRWLAPATTLFHADRLGETALLFTTPDAGQTWPESSIIFHDPEGVLGFFEQKVIALDRERLLATAWTVRMGDYRDLENRFSLSDDGGRSWSAAQPTGIFGQTMTPVWIRGDALLVLYNRRYGEQGVQMCLVRFSDEAWKAEYERSLWDARSTVCAPSAGSGIDELAKFSFGLPCGLLLDERTVLAAHWCVEEGVCLIRWNRLKLHL